MIAVGEDTPGYPSCFDENEPHWGNTPPIDKG